MTTRMYLLSMTCLAALIYVIWMDTGAHFDFADPVGLGEISVGLD